MEREAFEHCITDAIDMVPVHIRKRIENVAFVVDDIQEGRLLGLYHGIPLTRRGQGYSGVLPDKITIYQRTIERLANGDADTIRRIVTDTVHHEIGHYFGFSEAEVRTWELKRRTKNNQHD